MTRGIGREASDLLGGLQRALPAGRGRDREPGALPGPQGILYRSREEVALALELERQGLGFAYEPAVPGPGGTTYYPDFLITDCRGQHWILEHAGAWRTPSYRARLEQKLAWYERDYPRRALMTLGSLGSRRVAATEWPVHHAGQWIGRLEDVLLVLAGR